MIQNKPHGMPIDFNKFEAELGLTIVLICDKSEDDYLRYISGARERGIELFYILARGSRVSMANLVADSLVQANGLFCFTRKQVTDWHKAENRNVDSIMIGLTSSQQLASVLQQTVSVESPA
jgi:hypothetical protein